MSRLYRLISMIRFETKFFKHQIFDLFKAEKS